MSIEKLKKQVNLWRLYFVCLTVYLKGIKSLRKGLDFMECQLNVVMLRELEGGLMCLWRFLDENYLFSEKDVFGTALSVFAETS